MLAHSIKVFVLGFEHFTGFMEHFSPHADIITIASSLRFFCFWQRFSVPLKMIMLFLFMVTNAWKLTRWNLNFYEKNNSAYCSSIVSFDICAGVRKHFALVIDGSWRIGRNLHDLTFITAVFDAHHFEFVTILLVLVKIKETLTKFKKTYTSFDVAKSRK